MLQVQKPRHFQDETAIFFLRNFVCCRGQNSFCNHFQFFAFYIVQAARQLCIHLKSGEIHDLQPNKNVEKFCEPAHVPDTVEQAVGTALHHDHRLINFEGEVQKSKEIWIVIHVTVTILSHFHGKKVPHIRLTHLNVVSLVVQLSTRYMDHSVGRLIRFEIPLDYLRIFFNGLWTVFFIIELFYVHNEMYFCCAHVFFNFFKGLCEIHARSVPQIHFSIFSLKMPKMEVNRFTELVCLVYAEERIESRRTVIPTFIKELFFILASAPVKIKRNFSIRGYSIS